MKYRIYILSVLLLIFVACGGGEDEEIVIEGNGDDSEEQEEQDNNAANEDPGKQPEACYPGFADNELNVATWNIENYPMQGATTTGKVRDLLLDLDADIIALQEISDVSKFSDMVAAMEGWEVKLSDVRYGQEIGYLYKASVFTEVGETTELFGNDSYGFPREVVKLEATHISGLEVVFLNLHLKCCGSTGSDEFNRRQSASETIEEYIENNLDDQAVIVLGDFNDDITSITPFQNLIDDTQFEFADMGIAQGSSGNWSYPSFPSHLDHILITNELFEALGAVQTLKPESCITNYSNDVSDHRPVLASFSKD